jgi:hypothetical protein
MLTVPEGIGLDASLRFERAPRRVYWEVPGPATWPVVTVVPWPCLL